MTLKITREYVEANRDLITMKQSTKYPDLYVLKYKNRVFWDNLWTPELMECRGLVVDKDFNVVVRPFDKVFNRGENGTDFDRDAEVTYVRKVNGFLGCATKTEKYGVIYSTTGSLDSDFARMVEKHLKPYENDFEYGITYMFEICDESDPHIIKEEVGAYLIGMRVLYCGVMAGEYTLDKIASERGWKRFTKMTGRFSDVVKLLKEVKHEGFMVIDDDTDNVLKMKSPYYLATKFLARMREEKLLTLIGNRDMMIQRVDEEFYTLVDKIIEMGEEFTKMDEQARISFIENFYGVN